MKKKARIYIAVVLSILCAGYSFPSLAEEDSVGEADIEAETDAQKDEAEENISEIDLGSYQESMTVGEEQSLQIKLLPEGAGEQRVTYASSNKKVAEIDENGKITALKKGTTTISVKCQKIEKSFLLTVTENEKENEVVVKDIEIGEYEDTLEVGKTLELTATILPSDASNAAVTYVSNNPAVATVTSTGVVKGVSSGNVIISVSAGKITKEVSLTVKVSATVIQLNSTYVVLKPGQSYQLSAQVFPAEAAQSLTFKSTNSRAASVSDSGLIKGNGLGTATVLVSNGDITNAVTVIVNTKTSVVKNVKTDEGQEISEETAPIDEEALLKKIMDQKTVTVKAGQYPVITKNILKALYENQKKLQIESEDYILEINGKEIINYQNELSTGVKLKKSAQNVIFEINEGENLPGTVHLKIKDVKGYRYMYLYNTSKKKYEQIKISDINNIKLDTTGKYLLSKEKIRQNSFPGILLAGAGILLIGLTVFYILRKEKYWFW